MRKTVLLLVMLVAMAFWPTRSTGRDESASTVKPPAGEARTRPSDAGKDVLATVNGRPISEVDVRYRLKEGSHIAEVTPLFRQNTLEAIINEEILAQRAAELGLDADPAYQDKLRYLEAQLNAFKRKELRELFFRREVEAKAVVDEKEAKKYFEQNAARIHAQFHVYQILQRDEGLITQALKDIQHGTPFEEVAKRQFPRLPPGQTPWDLGYLRWNQVPDSWWKTLENLKKGEVSGIIRGPKNRFWIIMLVDKREDPDISFDAVKPVIVDVLKNAKVEELRERLELDLRQKAQVVYAAPKPSDVVPSTPDSNSE